MLGKNVTDSYKSIVAPSQLRQRVLQSAEKENVRRRPAGGIVSAAAVIAVALISSFVLMNTGVSVYTPAGKAGEEYKPFAEENPVAFARFAEELEVPLTLKVRGKTALDAEGGIILDGNGEKVSEISEKTEVLWVLPDADKEKTYTLTLTDEKNTYLITLSFFNEADCWKVCFTKE